VTTRSVSALTAQVHSVVARAYRANVFHLALSLAFLQGGPFLGQVVCARVLGPKNFGYVRVAETLLAILLIPAGLGMASAIVRFAAIAKAEHRGPLFLRRAVGYATTGSLVTATIATVAIWLWPLDAALRSALLLLVWSLPVTNIGRIAVNYLLADGQIRSVARANVITSCIALALTGAGAWLLQVQGWVFGRFFGELVPAGVLIWMVRRQLLGKGAPELEQVERRDFMRFGIFMALGTGVDRIASTADTLYLQSALADPALIGQYGAASLVVQAVGLLPAAAMATAMPRMAGRAPVPSSVSSFVREHAGTYIVGLAVLTALVMLLGPFALRTVLGSVYAPAAALLPGLAPTLLLGGLLQGGGAILFAFGRGDLALTQSALGLVLNIGLNVVLLPIYGIRGAVMALLGAYAGRLVLMSFLVQHATVRARLQYEG
jgi:O-antigen/teichoic acid export membrane protein